MKLLEINAIHGNQSLPLKYTVKRMVNAGYVGRDQEAVRAHIEELRLEGVPPPPTVPMIFPVLSQNITTSNQIEVVGSKTSGEVEFVLLINGDKIYVGIGSDHTDREVESHSIVKSKQICQNVMSSDVWLYEDVKSAWDDLLIQSWVIPEGSGEEILYQKAFLRSIISPEDILDLVKSNIDDGEIDGLVIFSGTVPIQTDEIIYATHFRGELIDRHLNRLLMCKYEIRKLDYLEDADFI